MRAGTAKVIDEQVEKVLRGLGHPEPPLDLGAVRALLCLDKRFYTTVENGFLREKVSRMTVGAKQILSNPTLLWDAIRKFDLKAIYIPGRKVILLDDSLPSPKLRWNEAHEAAHSLLEWHHEMMLGDTRVTLSPECHEAIENEANYGAGQLLFLRGRFVRECLDTSPSLKSVRRLSKSFGNTITSTLWRTVETLLCPAIGFIGPHPKRQQAGAVVAEPWRYFIRSPKFERQFSRSSPRDIFEKVRNYCGYSTKGPLGEGAIEISDDNGSQHIFACETFYNGYEALTLGICTGATQVLV